MPRLSTDEARLIAVYRAVSRVDHHLVGPQDASTLAAYLETVTDVAALDDRTEPEIDAFLDGYSAGFSAGRLVAAGISPDNFAEVEDGPNQTGVDPQTGDVRS